MKALENYIRKGGFFKAVVEDGSDIIFIVDFEGAVLYHNNSVHETLGYRARSLVGKKFFDYIIPSERDEFIKRFKHCLKRAYSEKIEFQFLCRDNTYRFLEFNAINLKNKEGIPALILDCRDITQRKRDAEELLRLQKAKDQFLANISHEIRTPINGIAGMASLLNLTPNAEERETYLSAIRHSAENLKVIINDILDLAAIDSGKLKFEKIAFNLNDILPSLISTFTYQAREKKIELSYSIDPSLNTFLLGDPVRLNQILINLISNAVKFTHHGSIKVRCSVSKSRGEKSWIAFEVCDTGIGIPSSKLNTIFESFSQADESVTRKYGGTGLGLTIVKQLVEMQRGSIYVSSQENIGSVFSVIIPYTLAKAKSFERKAGQKKLTSPFDLHNLKILLVEDNDINRLYAKSILKNWQCQADTAENGLIAIEKLKAQEYDVVLMDVQMPVMDGYETAKAIRLMPSPISTIPIIALSANATRSDAELCLAAGMNDYLAKPFTPEDLYSKLFHDLGIRPRHKHEKVAEPINGLTIDLHYLRSVSNDNAEFIRDIIETFIESLPTIIEQMKQALHNEDSLKAAQLAHQLKPSFTLLGVPELKKKAILIEEYGKSGKNLEVLAGLSQEFLSACKQIREQLIIELDKIN